MQILVKIAIFLLPVGAWSQIAFYKLYSDEGYDFGQGVVQLEDSSYVVAGTSGSFANNSQAFLMHVDSMGTKLWSNHYGGTESEWGQNVLYKENFGFFLCGYSNSFGTGDYDFYLVKVNESGIEEWSQTYGDSGWERAKDAVMARDTGAVIVGEKDNGAYGMDMYIVRTDKFGDTLWTKTLENFGEDVASSIDIYEDSILFVGGTMFNADSSQTKAVIYKIHDGGEMLDTLHFNTYPGEYVLNDLHVIGDTVQAIGSNRLNSGDEWDYTFYRSDLTVNGFGNISCFNSSVAGNYFGNVFTTYNNNSKRYLATGYEGTVGNFPVSPELHIQRGNTFMFYETSVGFFEYSEPDVSGEFIATNDGGAMLVGYHQSLSVGSGGGTVFLYKIGPDENYPTIANVAAGQLVNIREETAIDVSIYPNPSDDFIYITLPESTEGNFKLIDFSGQELRSGRLFGSAQLDVNEIAAGGYLIQIETNIGSITKRVIIQ